MKNLINRIIVCMLILVWTNVACAQTNEMDSASVAATLELVNVQNAVEAYDSSQFKLEIISTEGSYADTIVGEYALLGDFYKAIFDSVIQIQNQFLHLEVHEAGKMFIVSKPLPFSKQFLKGNIEEGLFQQMNVGSISMSTTGSDKTIHFNFLPESEYDTYTITYNASNYRVSEAYIKIKVTDDTGAFVSGQYSTTRISFFDFAPIAGTVSFDTNPYLYSIGGSQFQKQAAYNDYELVNLFEQQ